MERPSIGQVVLAVAVVVVGIWWFAWNSRTKAVRALYDSVATNLRLVGDRGLRLSGSIENKGTKLLSSVKVRVTYCAVSGNTDGPLHHKIIQLGPLQPGERKEVSEPVSGGWYRFKYDIRVVEILEKT